MVDVEKMSDASLRAELLSRGVNAGPVTGTTRSLFEKKLKKLLSTEGSKPATPAKATPAKATPAKPTPAKSPAAKVTPAKASIIPGKTATKIPAAAFAAPPVKKSPARSSTLNTTTTSSASRRSFAANKSEIEEESDEDDAMEDDDILEEEIISPNANRRSRVSASPKNVFVSTPNKNLKAKTNLNESTYSAKNTSRVTSSTFDDPIQIPNLIRSFDFSTPSVDRPGATPPRIQPNKTAIGHSGYKSQPTRTSVTASSFISTPRDSYKKNASVFSSRALADLGATTGDEDDDDDGLETSRVVYSTKEKERGGLIGRAWNKVLGNDFKTASSPGQSYDFRTGSSRTRVVRDPKTGKMVIKQSTVFGEALYVALYVLVILFVVLTIGYFLSTSDKPQIAGSIQVVTKTVRDTISFFYRYAIVPVFTALAVALLGVGAYFGHKKYKEVKEKEESELFDLIERITEIIRETSVDGEPYVSQPHVRDVIFPPAKRRSAELARWERAVAFIDAHDSRVATEVRVLPNGSECAVWRWTGHTQQKRNW